MLQMIDEGRALEITKTYFDILGYTGYIKPDLMSRYFLYMFLLDFVDYTHRFFTAEDYNTVDKALRKLFINGGCLLPYSVFCTDKVKLGRNEYMGPLKVRKTENDAVDKDGADIGYEDRFTQDDNLRTI